MNFIIFLNVLSLLQKFEFLKSLKIEFSFSGFFDNENCKRFRFGPQPDEIFSKKQHPNSGSVASSESEEDTRLHNKHDERDVRFCNQSNGRDVRHPESCQNPFKAIRNT